jgi:hypothetical protein
MDSSARHRDVDAAAQFGQLVDRRARLLEVLERPVGGQGPRGGHRFRQRPATVGVDPDRGNHRTGRVHLSDVVDQGLSRFGDLHLDGARPGEPGQHLGHLRGGTAGTVALISIRSRCTNGAVP